VVPEALAVVLQYSTHEQNLPLLNEPGLLKGLFHCLLDKATESLSLSLLINLSAESPLAQAILPRQDEILQQFLRALHEQGEKEDRLKELYSLLLVNLSREEAFVQAALARQEGLFLILLLNSYLSGSREFRHLGNVLLNVSALEAGRRALILNGLFQKFSPASCSPECLKVVKNCLLEYQDEALMAHATRADPPTLPQKLIQVGLEREPHELGLAVDCLMLLSELKINLIPGLYSKDEL
jgi:hypothetical protein